MEGFLSESQHLVELIAIDNYRADLQMQDSFSFGRDTIIIVFDKESRLALVAGAEL